MGHTCVTCCNEMNHLSTVVSAGLMPYIGKTRSWLELNICYFWIKNMVAFDCNSYISLRILLTQNQHWPYSSHSWQDIVKIKLTTAPVPPALSSASFPSNNPWSMWHFVDKKPPQTRITSEAAGMAVCFVHWKKAVPNSYNSLFPLSVPITNSLVHWLHGAKFCPS